MSQGGTVERILDAAERLFAERGFAETSLRTITSRANVNLAAVNYHFGSKNALIQAVFARFLIPFCAALEVALDLRTEDPSLEDVLAAVSGTAISVNAVDPSRGVLFMRLIGLAYTESQGHLRRYIATQHGATFQRLQRLLARAAPDVAPEEMFWRLHFALGSVLFTLSGLSSLQAISKSEFGSSQGFEQVAERLRGFVQAGVRQQAGSP